MLNELMAEVNKDKKKIAGGKNVNIAVPNVQKQANK